MCDPDPLYIYQSARKGAQKETHSKLANLVQIYACLIDDDRRFISIQMLHSIDTDVSTFVKQKSLSTTEDVDELLNEMVLDDLYESLNVQDCKKEVESDLCDYHTAVLECARELK
jgi:hypothetical protein